MSFIEKDPVQNHVVYLVVISLQFYSTCHSSSELTSMTLMLLKITGQLFCIMSLTLGLYAISSWLDGDYASLAQKCHKNVMFRFSYCTPLHAHDFNLSYNCGFTFIYLIKRCLPALSIVFILICKRSFLGCGGRVVLGNYTLKKKYYLVWIDPSFPVLVSGL